ncbi:MAG: TIR domain-containing protein [Hyphomonadaceae bacterium JAD_PAG50586_4]|nr:MAG: TIR domain-containing protein [Hyphomonadaceae bacterium JAD_PAG50586_4]
MTSSHRSLGERDVEVCRRLCDLIQHCVIRSEVGVANGEKRYRAFISYSWQDKAWGKRIHAWLETYRVPAGAQDAAQLPRSLGRIFRDDDDMAAASDIGEIVRDALDNSESLIVVCSPRSAESKWIEAEVLHFRRTEPGRKVFAVIIDGEPNSGDPETECFPPSLRAVHHADGRGEMPIEPVGLDVRRDGRARTCARLTAGLFDVDFDDIWQRDRRRTEKRQRIAVGAFAALSIVFACLATLATYFGLHARSTLLRFHVVRAEEQLNREGNVILAAKYALAGMRLSPRNTREYRSVLGMVMQQAGESLPPLAHDGQVWTATFSPDGARVLTASYDGTARLWDASRGTLLATLHHDDAVLNARFSADGTRIVTASFDGSAKVWDAANGRLSATLRGHDGQVLSARFSPDGLRVVTASNDHTAKVWSAEDGRLIATLEDHDAEVLSAAFSADGRRIVTASVDQTAKVWAVDGRLLFSLRGHDLEVVGAEFSPNGRLIVTAGGDMTARLWSASRGRLVATLRGHEGEVLSARFSPDSSSVVTASSDGTARIWRARDGWRADVLRGHRDQVSSAAFSTDGSRIATASNDGTARVWNAADGRLVATLSGHVVVRDAAFSPDGHQVVTASWDNTAKIWQLPEERAIEISESLGGSPALRSAIRAGAQSLLVRMDAHDCWTLANGASSGLSVMARLASQR